MKPAITITSDFTDQFNEAIKRFRNDDVLVGIPASTSDRKDDTAINNATILAINEFGSPSNNIPARPVMAIGIRNAQEQIAEEFRKAAVGVLSKGVSALTTYFNRVGIIASTSIKKVINDQEGIDPPAASTLAARKSKGFKGEKALIVSGQMRNSITYVVRNGKR